LRESARRGNTCHNVGRLGDSFDGGGRTGRGIQFGGQSQGAEKNVCPLLANTSEFSDIWSVKCNINWVQLQIEVRGKLLNLWDNG